VQIRDFFGGEFSHFAKSNFKERNIFVANSLFKTKKKHRQKTKKIQKIAKNRHTSLQFEKVPFFTFVFLIYCQIWLNTLLDHHHLSNITKLKQNTGV